MTLDKACSKRVFKAQYLLSTCFYFDKFLRPLGKYDYLKLSQNLPKQKLKAYSHEEQDLELAHPKGCKWEGKEKEPVSTQTMKWKACRRYHEIKCIPSVNNRLFFPSCDQQCSMHSYTFPLFTQDAWNTAGLKSSLILICTDIVYKEGSKIWKLLLVKSD